MSHAPRPQTCPSSIRPLKGSPSDHDAGSPAGTTSTWPPSRSSCGPPASADASGAQAARLARPGATGHRSTSRPRPPASSASSSLHAASPPELGSRAGTHARHTDGRLQAADQLVGQHVDDSRSSRSAPSAPGPHRRRPGSCPHRRARGPARSMRSISPASKATRAHAGEVEVLVRPVVQSADRPEPVEDRDAGGGDEGSVRAPAGRRRTE